MPVLDSELAGVIQRTGSSTGRLSTDAERASFSQSVRGDLTAIIYQLNTIHKVLADGLVSEAGLDALDNGLVGNVILADIAATVNSADVFWNSSKTRANTIKEAIDAVLGELAVLENSIGTIAAAVAAETATATVTSLAGTTVVEVTSTPYTVLVSDEFIIVNVASGVVNLPAGATLTGKKLVIKDKTGNAAINNITISADGSETIDGAASEVLDADYAAMNLVFSGTEWSIY